MLSLAASSKSSVCTMYFFRAQKAFPFFLAKVRIRGSLTEGREHVKDQCLCVCFFYVISGISLTFWWLLLFSFDILLCQLHQLPDIQDPIQANIFHILNEAVNV